ncbi:cytochrome C peroxidase [Aliikangiella marina]|uniref:Cytochrome C peroxidase n=1 Tax=Aliikangiella marina TaxID=1712262 RepID=A0A545TE57_9GAMM|nr:cytochrome c peroxidase [Aliikangiella marina]TQV75504.1 cytochrome C peroxidase [Aliikangiella marina]
MRCLLVIISLTLLSCSENSTESVINHSTSNNDPIYQFTPADIRFLSKFSLDELGKPPKSYSNQYANNDKAAQFGKILFFDKQFSRSGVFSCATCHQPNKFFTDGLQFSIAEGIATRNSPTLIGSAYSPWQYWDGRKDSLWSQALAPIEAHNELDTSRVEYVRKLAADYREIYQETFGEKDFSFLNLLPEKASPIGDQTAQKNWHSLNKSLQKQVNDVFSNAGKAMMAYQRKIKLPKSRFDQFIEALVAGEKRPLAQLMSASEVRGLRLFVGKANCASCHNGPLFTNYEFHNIGAPDLADKPVELGRFAGVKALLTDEFTCLSEWSDANKSQCQEMRFLKTKGPELVGALKTPTLRNIANTAPYMQFGQFKSLRQVLAHYNDPTPPVYDMEQHPSRPHFDILPLKLNQQELTDLESFLGSLTSPLPQDDHWWGLNQENNLKAQIALKNL